MTKYLVVANTYGYGYGCELTCFGIFDSEEEALKWIFDHPVVDLRVPSFNTYCGGVFDFFYYWKADATLYATKEEYAKSYIKKFDGSPIYLGGYVE